MHYFEIAVKINALIASILLIINIHILIKVFYSVSPIFYICANNFNSYQIINQNFTNSISILSYIHLFEVIKNVMVQGRIVFL